MRTRTREGMLMLGEVARKHAAEVFVAVPHTARRIHREVPHALVFPLAAVLKALALELRMPLGALPIQRRRLHPVVAAGGAVRRAVPRRVTLSETAT